MNQIPTGTNIPIGEDGRMLRTRDMRKRQKIAAGILSGVVCVTVFCLTFFISKALSADKWFSIILSVANATLGFCAARIAVDENSFDDGQSPAYVMMAGVLAFIGIVLTYITLGVFPFGENSVMIVDMHHQYACFFSMMRDKLLGGGSLFYNTSAGLGSCFTPLFAYYLASPFNIVMLLFPRELLTEAIAAVTILKITTCGVTFAVMAKGILKRNDFSIVCGGAMYSMISFLIVHSWNIMWLDVIALLPLIVLGLEKLLREKKPALYCITLALAIIINYYIAYMVCVFLVIYFIAYLVCEAKGKGVREKLGDFGRFCAASLISGGTSMVLLLPTVIYLMQTSGAEDSFSRELDSNFELFELFQRLMFAPTPSIRGMSLPNVYCSLLAVLMTVLFISCKKIPVRKRVTWGCVVLAVIGGMSINWTNFAWHGFHFPNDLPYRESFILSFVLVYLAVLMLDKLDSLSIKGVVVSWGIIAAVIFYEERFGDKAVDFRTVYTSLLFVTLYAAIALLCAAGKLKKTLCYSLMLLFVFSEVTANASVNIRMLDDNEGGTGNASGEYFTIRDNYARDYDVNAAAIDIVEGFDEPEYRMELSRGSGTCNDPSLFNYSGMTVFASSNPKVTTTFMGQLGYAINGVNSYLFRNFVPAADSLFGIKYLVTEGADPDADCGAITALNFVNSVYDEDGLTRYVYQNANALPRLFLANSAIKMLDMEYYGSYPNPFEVQNDIYRQLSGVDDVYKMNTDLVLSEGNDIGSVYGNYFSYTGYGSALTASYKTVETGNVYVYVDCRAAETISVSTDGDWVASPSENEPYIVSCGRLEAGTSIDVSVTAEGSCGGYIYIATLDEALFTQAVNTLKAGGMSFDEYTEDHIKGTVNAAHDGTMFSSIPFDSGWRVYVDGVKTETYSIGGAMLGFDISAGAHTVELKFIPSGFAAGVIITVISLFAMILFIRPDWARKMFSPIINYIRRDRTKPVILPAGQLPKDFLDVDDFDEIDMSRINKDDLEDIEGEPLETDDTTNDEAKTERRIKFEED